MKDLKSRYQTFESKSNRNKNISGVTEVNLMKTYIFQIVFKLCIQILLRLKKRDLVKKVKDKFPDFHILSANSRKQILNVGKLTTLYSEKTM